MPFWTDDRIAELKLLIPQKFSAGEIATKMGLTRNMVVGKATRLGLRLQGKPVLPPKLVTVPRPPRQREKMVVIALAPLVTPPVPIPAMPTTKAAPVHILDLQDHHCRAVLDQRGAFGLAMFCGATKASASSYCAFHTGLFIQPPKETTHGKASDRQQSV